jgi:hypothetical protein
MQKLSTMNFHDVPSATIANFLDAKKSACIPGSAKKVYIGRSSRRKRAACGTWQRTVVYAAGPAPIFRVPEIHAWNWRGICQTVVRPEVP